ncbi:hypothetical protein [Bizionia sp.]|uniref:hypothetical protein n=1 Tax=Bizionia sp. TaxID=1954480 RepID=UPI003A8FE140
MNSKLPIQPNYEAKKNVIKLTNGLHFVSVVKQTKAAVRTAEDGLAQRLPSAGKGFYAVFKQTKISLAFFVSFLGNVKKKRKAENSISTAKYPFGIWNLFKTLKCLTNMK